MINKPEAIIIANGKDWLIERDQILDYFKTNNLETLHINYPLEKYTLPFIKAFCSCDPIKIINDYKSYSQSKKIPLICPLNTLEKLDIDQKQINIKWLILESNKLLKYLEKDNIESLDSLSQNFIFIESIDQINNIISRYSRI